MTRQAAVQGLAASNDPRVIAFLIKQTGESVDEARRLEAIEAMGQRGNGLVLGVLHKLLEAKSNQIRIAAAKSILNLGMPDSAPALLAALKRENKSMVRGHLARALAACDPVTPDHRAFLVGMIKSPSQADKLNGIRAASGLAMDDELKKALLVAMKDSNPSVRGISWWVLGDHKVAEAGVHIAKAVLTEKNPDTKNLGLDALSRITGAAYDGPAAETCLSNLFATSGLGW